MPPRLPSCLRGSITLPDLPGPGTYRVRARLDDAAGNAGTSAAATFTIVDPSTPSVVWAGVLQSDPLQGNASIQLGNVQVTHLLDIDDSPGTTQDGNLALVYNSDSITNPVVQTEIQTSNTEAVPSSITVALTWDGVTQGASTIGLVGVSPGDLVTIAQQVTLAWQQGSGLGMFDPDASGHHSWSESLTLNSATPTTFSESGSTFVDFQGNSSFGSGWTLSNVNQLVPVSADSLGSSTGELMLYGTGGFRFFAGGSSTFTSPANDNGTLTFNGSNFFYTQPNGDTTTFNGGGYQTEWSNPDGQQTLHYNYVGGKLDNITNIDGSVATLSYGGNGILDEITASNGRETTLTTNALYSYSYNANEVTSITNPDGGVDSFTYATPGEWTIAPSGGIPLITQQYFGSLYKSLELSKRGSASCPRAHRQWSVRGLCRSRHHPRLVVHRGRRHADRGHVRRPGQSSTQWQLDDDGHVTQELAPNGGLTTWQYDSAGLPTTVSDPLDRTTDYAYDGRRLPDPSKPIPTAALETYAYQTLDHELTATTDADGNTTTYAYDSLGHQTSMTDALGQTTTAAYNASGLLTSQTDPLTHTTTFAYDSYRRLTSQTDALGHTTAETYDLNGNLSTTTDADGHVTATSYDAMGHLISTTDPVGDTTAYTYDAAGMMVTETDPKSVVTSWSYNAWGQWGDVVTTTEALGTGVQRSVLTSYTFDGMVAGTRDGLGNSTIYGYDSVNDPTTVTNALSQTATTLPYDLAGQGTETIDAWATSRPRRTTCVAGRRAAPMRSAIPPTTASMRTVTRHR